MEKTGYVGVSRNASINNHKSTLWGVQAIINKFLFFFFFNRTEILPAFSSRQRIQAAFTTLIQVTGWTTERKMSPSHETVRPLQG